MSEETVALLLTPFLIVTVWTIPNPGIAAEMYFRLSPDRDTSLEPEWMRSVTFTDADFADTLRYHNYPVYWRDKLKAISYRPVQQRFLRLLVAQGKIGVEQTTDYIKRLGLMPDVARSYAEALVEDVEDKQNPVRNLEHGVYAKYFAAMLEAYKVGTLTRDQCSYLGSAIGLKDTTTKTYLDITDSDIRAKHVSEVIESLEKDYMEGVLKLEESKTILAQIGIAGPRIDDYLTLWQARRTLRVKTVSTGQLLNWFSSGIIDLPTLQSRLANLGWIYPDLLGYLAQGELAIAKRQAMIRSAEYRTAKANAALLEKQLRAAQKQVTDLQRELGRLTPVGRLIKWARQGSISAQYFENRLEAMGYTPDLIAEYWLEVQKDGPLPKPPKPAKSVSSTAGGVAGNGTSTATGGATSGGGEPSQSQTKPPIDIGGQPGGTGTRG